MEKKTSMLSDDDNIGAVNHNYYDRYTLWRHVTNRIESE